MRTRFGRFSIVTLVLITSFLNILVPAEGGELGVNIERDVPVAMRDGTVLRADVRRPDRGGPYPVLVQRTPYGKGRNFDRFVKAGYIVVNQDVRGRYASEGKWGSLYRFKTHEAKDGYDTIEWAARLPGSTGKVGTFGTSYPALLQWRLAPLRPPSLVAMSACSIPAQIWYGENPCTIRPGFRLDWLASMAVDMRRHENLPGVHTSWEHYKLRNEESEKWLEWLPWLDLPQDIFGYETGVFKSWMKSPNTDPWRLDEGCEEVTVPNLDMVGWYDHANGDMLLFRTMVKQAKTKIAREGSRIIIGPWTHGTTYARKYANIDFGPDAVFDKRAAQIRWFDYWLKGIQDGVDKDLPVRIFVMGDNKWRDEQHWPLQRTNEKVLHITSDGHANTPSGSGNLISEKPTIAGVDNFIYDPSNPVPTPSGSRRPIPADQRPLASRQDILVYQTEPLTKRVEVTGNPVVELHASSSAPDTDWFVRLIDVAPDGLARDVSSGLMRARYRCGFDKPKLIQPGEVIKYTIRMNPTSNAFLPGHRIRLDITSSDFPNFDRNHNTAANQNADAILVTAKQTVYHGGQHATRIILPWVPNTIESVEPTVDVSPETVAESKEEIYPLHRASADGDIELVQKLLLEGADVNALDEEQNTPLCCAIKARQKEVTQLLVEADADVNAGSSSPLYIAVDINDIAAAQHLFAHGAKVNPDRRWTPLKQTPYSSSVEMARLLIEKGADINSGPWTVWHGAIEEERMDIMRLLIRKGMDVNTVDEDGMSPLVFALTWPKEEMAGWLLANGAGIPRRKTKRGITLLHNAAVLGQKRIADLLLAKGSEVDERDDVYEFTALHYAARFGHEDIAEALIDKGADITAEDRWQYRPIHWAAYHDRPDVVKLLIAKGANVNARTSLGQTPLQLATPRRNTKTIELLKKHGAKD